MKNDLVSAIGIAVLGVLIAFFACKLIVGPIEDFSFKKINTSVSADLVNPDPEVFNYKAIDPTVEVYVNGDCPNGDCTEAPREGE